MERPEKTTRKRFALGRMLGLGSLVLSSALAAAMFVPDSAGTNLSSKTIKIDPVGTSDLDTPAEPEVFKFQDVEPQKAAEINAAMPVATGPILPARPFSFDIANTTAISRLNAVDCMTAAIYYEAASETELGQRAVAQVILNRMRHPAYPKTVCGVVFQGSERSTGCQFTFTCDGSLARSPAPALWQRARRIAEQALAGYVERSVGTATHYHTVWVVPYWNKNLAKVTTLGAHIFYRWQGSWGMPAAFTGGYGGTETQPAKLTSLKGFLMASEDLTKLEQQITGIQPAPSTNVAMAGPVMPPSPLPTSRSVAADDNKPTLMADQDRGVLIR